MMKKKRIKGGKNDKGKKRDKKSFKDLEQI